MVRCLVALLMAGVVCSVSAEEGMSASATSNSGVVCKKGAEKAYFAFLGTAKGAREMRHGSAVVCVPREDPLYSQRVIDRYASELQKRTDADVITILNIIRLEE